MVFAELPPSAAWQHRDARDGFEVVFVHATDDGHRIEGHTCAVEDGVAWVIEYRIVVDANWTTRSAHILRRSATGRSETRLDADRAGEWQVDGQRAAHLAGCLDVDLESSVLTNALPIHRLRPTAGESGAAPAAYVRAADVIVERLEQRYERIEDDNGLERYAYSAPRFGYTGILGYDASGLLLDYPGIARRVA
jgi:uncharacterized protein